MDYEIATRVLRALEEEHVEYALFGGAALNLHGIARFTEDMDIFVAPRPENIERVKKALRSIFDDPEIDAIDSAELCGEYPAVQYVPPEGSFHFDLLTRIGNAFAFEDLEVIRLPLDDFHVSVVSPRTLYEMKRDTVRLKDRADAQLLRERFGLEDE